MGSGNHTLYKTKMACKQKKQHLGSRCGLLSDPSTLGGWAKARLESSIKEFKPHLKYGSSCNCLFLIFPGRVVNEGVSDFLTDQYKIAATVGIVTSLAAGTTPLVTMPFVPVVTMPLATSLAAGTLAHDVGE